MRLHAPALVALVWAVAVALGAGVLATVPGLALMLVAVALHARERLR